MATRIQKQTAQRMIEKLQGELNSLFEHQEMGKGGRMARKYCSGGKMRKPKAWGGLQMGLSSALQSIPKGVQSKGIGDLISGLTGGVQQGMTQSQPLPRFDYATSGSGNNLTFGSRLKNFFNRPGVQGFGRGLGELGYQAGSFAPALYNLGMGLQPAEQINYRDYRNPEYNRAVSLMANRRYDPSSELGAVEEADAVYRQGLRNLPQSTGALQNRLASAATRRYKGRADVFTRAQNINQGYRGEEAQFRAGLGAQDAAMRFNVDDVNARNRAAKRNYLGESMTNLQQVAMQNRLMRNQRQRDDRLFQLAQSMAEQYGFMPDYSLYFKGGE